MIKKIHLTILILISLIFISCGDSSSPSSSEEKVLSGYFIDSPVVGLSYETESISGLTSNEGKFNYTPNDKSISFSVGKIRLGEMSISDINNDSKVLIQDLVGISRNNIEHEKVLKIAMFLQSLNSNTSEESIIIDEKDRLVFNTIEEINDIDIEETLSLVNRTPKDMDRIKAHLVNNFPVQMAKISEDNIQPIAINSIVRVKMNQSKPITLKAHDEDNDKLTYHSAVFPKHGSMRGTRKIRTYTPKLDYVGTDFYKFRVSDGKVNSNIAIIKIIVSPLDDSLNTAPVAVSKNFIINQNSLQKITLDAQDSEEDPLTYQIVSQPKNGRLIGKGKIKFYSPNNNFKGTDSFTFTANDGSKTSEIATVNITIKTSQNGNITPIVSDFSVTVEKNHSQKIVLKGEDANGDRLTYHTAVFPKHGSMRGRGKVRIYTPNENYVGTDMYRYRISDGKVNSRIATVSMTIKEVTPVIRKNVQPIAMNDSIELMQESSKEIMLRANDADGDRLTYIIVSQPKNGTLSTNTQNTIYTPNIDFSGIDTFTFKVNDGKIDSKIATVSISINPNLKGNTQPTVTDALFYTPHNRSKLIRLLANDADGDRLTYVVVSEPTHGVVTGKGVYQSYMPNKNFVGVDSFQFQVNDGFVNSRIATVTVNIQRKGIINNRPNAYNVSTNVFENSNKNLIRLNGNDYNGDVLRYRLKSEPKHGQILLSSKNTQEVFYTPNANYTGTDNFNYAVWDGDQESKVKTVTITIKPEPISPDQPFAIAHDYIFEVDSEDNNITLQAQDKNNNNPITYTIVDLPEHGILNGIEEHKIYIPNSSYEGSDSFSYYVNNQLMDSDIVKVNILMRNIASKVKKTEQTESYDKNGNRVETRLLRDDAYYQYGVKSSYRRSENMVVDYITGLIWQDNETIYQKSNKADNYCTNLRLGEYDDWRLPTIKELTTILVRGKKGKGFYAFIDNTFVNKSPTAYWTSQKNGGLRWIVSFYGGEVSWAKKNTSKYVARCVRN